MCTVLLPPGGYPIAVKYIISYHISYHIISYTFICGAATQRVSWPPHSWGFIDHTQRRTTVGTTPLDEWSAHRRDLFLTTHNTTNIHAPLGFEPTISAGERSQTYTLDRAATGTGISYIVSYHISYHIIYRIISYIIYHIIYIISYIIISYHISYHIIYHHIISYIISYHTISYHISYHIPYHIYTIYTYIYIYICIYTHIYI
jgi:hypothetical protein